MNDFCIPTAPAKINLDVAALLPTEHLKPLPKNGDALLSIGIAFGDRHQDTEPPHPVWLLCVRPQRQTGCRAADKSDEVSPLHVSPQARTTSCPAESSIS